MYGGGRREASRDEFMETKLSPFGNPSARVKGNELSISREAIRTYNIPRGRALYLVITCAAIGVAPGISFLVDIIISQVPTGLISSWRLNSELFYLPFFLQMLVDSIVSVLRLFP